MSANLRTSSCSVMLSASSVFSEPGAIAVARMLCG